jgi:hypothetical protein
VLGLEKLIRQVRSALGLEPQNVAVEVAPPPPATLASLAADTDALFKREVADGCTTDVETRIREIRRVILADEVIYEGTEAEQQSLDWLWVSMLRLGLFAELLHLVRRFDLPLRPEVKTFSEFCDCQYQVNRQRGEAYRARHPDTDIFTMGCIVWGDEYVGNFLKYNVRSMLSPGNLPALSAQGRIVMAIVTDAAGEASMRAHAVFRELGRYADVQFTVVPPELIGILRRGHLVQHFYILYGMLDHCSIYFAQGARSHLFMIPVDAIVADGSLNNMANYRRQGYECCGGGNIVADASATRGPSACRPRSWRRWPSSMPTTISGPRCWRVRTSTSASIHASCSGQSTVAWRSIRCSSIRCSPAPRESRGMLASTLPTSTTA